MENGQDSSGSVDEVEVAWEIDTELYQLAVDGSDLQYFELIGESLTWTSDLESLKKFVESCLQQQGKWISRGGNTKQFKSYNNKVVITWYNKKQHTLVFRGQNGPVLKVKLVTSWRRKPTRQIDQQAMMKLNRRQMLKWTLS